VAPAFRRDPWPHFHEFGITRGDVTGIHAAHAIHPQTPSRARIRTRGAPSSAVTAGCWKPEARSKSLLAFGAFGAFNAFSAEARSPAQILK